MSIRCIDDMIQRMAKINDILFGDRKEFVYFAPGAVRIAEKASAPVKNRSHKIETTIELEGGEEGVIVSCGGMTGGYTMYIKKASCTMTTTTSTECTTS